MGYLHQSLAWSLQHDTLLHTRRAESPDLEPSHLGTSHDSPMASNRSSTHPPLILVTPPSISRRFDRSNGTPAHTCDRQHCTPLQPSLPSRSLLHNSRRTIPDSRSLGTHLC